MTNKDSGCVVEGCWREVVAKGMCGMHYHRLLRGAPLGTADGRMVNAGRPCSVEGCDRGADTKGYCAKHYEMFRRHGDANWKRPVKTEKDQCSVEVDNIRCEREVLACGMCKLHYERVQRTGKPGPLGLAVEKQAGRTCSVDGCSNPAASKGYCRRHYMALNRYGDANYPLKRRPNGVNVIKNGGYVYVTINGEQILEHRYVMEQMLGRKLLPTENVHHRNGVRDDNRPENLELWKTPQPPGARASDLVQYAQEILFQYGDRESILDIVAKIRLRDAMKNAVPSNETQTRHDNAVRNGTKDK